MAATKNNEQKIRRDCDGVNVGRGCELLVIGLGIVLRGAACAAPRRLDYSTDCLVSTAKPYRDLVRAVPCARVADPIRIGSIPSAADVIGVGTTAVRHGGNQRTAAIDVDVSRGHTIPEQVHRLQAVHFVTTRLQRGRSCRCRRCSRRSCRCG